ncbi:GGDEF family protein [Vibrio ichthyoenteri ATCC 700023]|uniref:GGDEF family protein n=1 Tax=Vibrio ichthyoenteri ATCC 700023 TaxID=870968 RepID=F9RYQ2_9VIBR|nr:diguanylate cyclase [Vibrio ichthyoenteri]EGU46328.1 GGDEF family protein [Vibrio ichthyoenteri ATCC 700023]
MRSLFNNHQISRWIVTSAIKFSIVPLLYFVPVFVFQIQLESIYDYLLEVTRLYCVILMTSMIGKLVNSKLIKTGLMIAVANGVYDSITEIVYIDLMISSRFPFADALLDEALLIIGYGCIIRGLYLHFTRINKLTLTDNLTKCYTLPTLDLVPVGAYQVFYFDIDNFKKINKAQGHDVGNNVLNTFATQLISSCSNLGYVFRIEADKFLAVVDIAQAQEYIDSVTKAYERKEITFSSGTAACFNNKFKAAISEAQDNLREMRQCKNGIVDNELKFEGF